MDADALLAEIEAIVDRPSPPTVNLVEEDAVLRFAEAVGDPIVTDDGALVVPPTFLCSLRYRRPPMPGGAEDRMVILDSSVALKRLPVIGERITAAATFVEARPRGPLILLKLACRYTDERDIEIGVITCSWMIDVENERPAAPATFPRRPRPELQGATATADQESINGHGGPDPRPARVWPALDPKTLAPGQELPPLAKAPLSTLQFAKYAGASHDFNPIHYDSHFAAEAGFPDAIAPGLMKLAFFGEHMTLWSCRWGRLQRLDAKYRGIDLPGARLTCCGTVKGVAPDGVVTVDLTLRDEDGEVHTVGAAAIEPT